MSRTSSGPELIGDRWVVGIDPGWKGAITCIQPSTGSYELWKIDEKTRLSGLAWAQNFGVNHDIALICKELVGPRPRDGKRQVFTFGGSNEYAYLLVLLMGGTKRFRYKEVTPAKWRDAFGIGRRTLGKETTDHQMKQHSQKVARRLHKKHCPFEITQRIADSVLIAEYAKRYIHRATARGAF